MRTLTLDKPGSLRMHDTDPPDALNEGEALVRVHNIGICGTDLHAYRGRQPFFSYPRILGHELGVEVVEVCSPESPLRPGDRCAVEPYLNCGHCSACRRGKTNCCTSLQVLGVHTDGGMREYIKIPTAKLHRSEILGLEQLALVETLGIGAHAVQRAALKPGDDVLVMGAGPIGLGVIQFACLAGANVTVLDVNPRRLSFCAANFNIAHAIQSTPETLSRMEQEELPVVVFDATGNPDSMMRAFSFVAHGGTLVFVGLFQGDVTFHDPTFHRREMSILSSRNALSPDFPAIISHLEAGRVRTGPWITHRADLPGTIRDFESWLKPETGVVKAMVSV
jgi:2-desacetyl-2-hydroxyethyl bacteriochlorophyllide A dehydrogenase